MWLRVRLTTILRLLLSSGPSAILSRVRAIVVDSIDCQIIGRSRSHVDKELFERLTPFNAQEDTSSTVIFVALALWVFASLFHGCPDVVFTGASQAMRSTPIAEVITLETSTRGYVPVPQFAHFDRLYNAAVALTDPASNPASFRSGFSLQRSLTENNEATVPLASQIEFVFPRMAATFVPWHNGNFTTRNTMHPNGWLRRVAA